MDKVYTKEHFAICTSGNIDSVTCEAGIKNLTNEYNRIVNICNQKYAELDCTYAFELDAGEYYSDFFIVVTRLETDAEYHARIKMVSEREDREYNQYLLLKKKFEPTTDQ